MNYPRAKQTVRLLSLVWDVDFGLSGAVTKMDLLEVMCDASEVEFGCDAPHSSCKKTTNGFILFDVSEYAITGREGFFCLVSNEKLTLAKALEIYRMKDAIEKVFQSLKNDINIKPLRVWTTKSLCGAILIGFLAQLIISLIRYDYAPLRQVAPKFIKISLMNLTVTIERAKAAAKRRIFSNFDAINGLICCQNQAIT